MQWKRFEFAAESSSNSGRPNQSRCVCDDALEPRIDCAGAIGRGGRSAGRTLSDLLATSVQLLPVDRVPAQRKREDLTQGFFQLLLTRRDLDAARREKGRLRSYLLVSFKHFLGGERRREMTIKRGHGQWLIPLEELHATERAGLPAGGLG